MVRGLKSTLALLVVLIGLGAYIYFVTWQQPDTSTPAREKVFAGVEGAQIEQVKVKAESGELTTVRKESGAWQVVDPVKAPAAESEVASITSAIERLDIDRVIEEKPTDLATYGLATPRIEVEFTSGGGKPSGRLLIGDKTPTGGGLYAKRNDEPRVFMIAEYQQSSLNKTTFDLRDKTVLKVSRDAIDTIEISPAGGTPLRFAKQGADWRITAPLAARADFGSVDGIISRVETAQMKAIAAEQPTAADLRKFGLEKPELTVSLNAGSSRATLAIGGKAADDAVYVRDVSKPAVVTVDSSLAEDLRKNADEYRRKDVFEFRAFNATRAELTRDGQTLVLERVKAKEEGGQDTWRRVSPNAGEADRTKVETLLAGLADIRATSFTGSTAKTGLDTPALTAVVTFEDGKKQERVAFGKSGADAYALVAEQPGAAKIEVEKLDEAIKAIDELAK
jgi:hypothetical protein